MPTLPIIAIMYTGNGIMWVKYIGGDTARIDSSNELDNAELTAYRYAILVPGKWVAV